MAGLVAGASSAELLAALVHGRCLASAVPLALARVERDPLASAGRFRGELLRALMEVPGAHWARHPRQHARYLAALRAAAALRRRLPAGERMLFWTPLTVPAPPSRPPDDEAGAEEGVSRRPG